MNSNKPSAPRREFIIRLGSISTILATGPVLSACGGGDDDPAVPPVDTPVIVGFDYGVASGDPLSDRVILWTHAKLPESSGTRANETVELTYEVATNAEFTALVTSGKVSATSASGFTAKIDATGLAAGQDYFYRFRATGVGQTGTSAVGRTRTLPSTASEVRFAVFSCSNFPAGFFNVYGEAARSDAQYAIHLGDYIYEYAADGYASQNAAVLGRSSVPATEILSLDDYRKRHAQYKSDPDLKQLHARMPMIAVWDDHELTNDTYKDGAQNHTDATEGVFSERRDRALQVHHEWMPIRTAGTAAAPQRDRIYRSFNFGSLVSLHMLDTRVLAREKQLSLADLANPTTQAATFATLSSSTRQLLGAEQVSWLQGQIGASTATWQVLGQQVLMARMSFPLSVLSAFGTLRAEDLAAAQKAVENYLAAKAKRAAGLTLTAEETALLDIAKNPKIGYNLDAWDGYPAAREVVLNAVAQANKKLVVLAGDTHNAWHADLTLANGTKVGEEFATPGVSSPGLESVLSTLTPAQIKSIFEGVIDDLNWMDASRRGFLKMSFTAQQAKGEWVFINTIQSRTYTLDTPAPAETRIYAA